MIIAILASIALFPFYWMIVSSFRTNPEIFSTKLNLIPKLFTAINYSDLIKKTSFTRWILNSVIVAVSTTTIGLFFSTFAGYAFAKYRFFFKNVLFLLVLLIM